MARTVGANTKLFIKAEATYGVQAAGNFNQVPFYSNDLGSDQPLLTPTVIGLGATRDPAAPIKDVISVAGQCVVPVDLVNIGHWLKLVMGVPVTTGAADFVHTFKSGGVTPSYSIENSLPEVPEFPSWLGVKGGSIAFDFSPSGPAQATIQMVGQTEQRGGATISGAPVAAAFTPFAQFNGSIKRNTVSLASVVAGSLVYSNNLDVVRTIRADGKIEGADPTITNISGSIRVRYADTVLMLDATGGVAVAIEFAYTISATRKLTLTIPECYLPKPKTVVTGPGGVEATFDLQGAYNVGQLAALVAVLSNQSAGTVYA